MRLFSKKTTVLITAITLTLTALHADGSNVKLQTNPKLLVAYPYFSVKFVPNSLSKANRTKSIQLANNTSALANPNTDSQPFSLSDMLASQVEFVDHSVHLMRHNLRSFN